MNYDVLYMLQSLRNTWGDAGVAAMNEVSELSLTLLIPLVLVFYWCINKKIGQAAFLAYSGTFIFNHIIKLTFCIERPWLVDGRIKPPKIAIDNQGGYSFPSGHVSIAASTLGALLLYYKKLIFSIVGWSLIALSGFSRCYLGVHTPLDVTCGIVEAIVISLIVKRIYDKVYSDGKNVALFTVSAILFGVLTALYFHFKPYPVHYDYLGNVIANPRSNITYSGVALFIGAILGVYIENRYIRFSTDVTIKQKICRLLFGAALYIPVMLMKNMLFPILLQGDLGSTVSSFMMALFGMAVLPFFFKYIDKIGVKNATE